MVKGSFEAGPDRRDTDSFGSLLEIPETCGVANDKLEPSVTKGIMPSECKEIKGDFQHGYQSPVVEWNWNALTIVM